MQRFQRERDGTKGGVSRCDQPGKVRLPKWAGSIATCPWALGCDKHSIITYGTQVEVLPDVQLFPSCRLIDTASLFSHSFGLYWKRQVNQHTHTHRTFHPLHTQKRATIRLKRKQPAPHAQKHHHEKSGISIIYGFRQPSHTKLLCLSPHYTRSPS